MERENVRWWEYVVVGLAEDVGKRRPVHLTRVDIQPLKVYY